MAEQSKLIARTLGPAALLLFAAACAAGREAVDARLDLQVAVVNDLVPPSALTVWIVSEAEHRRTLGTVAAGGTREFAVEPPGTAGTFRLDARAAQGREIVSDPFALFRGMTVAWYLQSNLVRMERDPDP